MRKDYYFSMAATLFVAAWAVDAMAQTDVSPFPGSEALIIEQPAGKNAWYSRECTKYMKLLGPLEYGGEKSVPSMIVESDDGKVYIGGVFTDFENAGWLTGDTDESGDITLKFPQIIYDEDYKGSHYFYYAGCMRLSDDNTDMEVTKEQTITLHRETDGNLTISEPDIAIGVCYLYNPASSEQVENAGYKGCELAWYGIAYSGITWKPVNTDIFTIPAGLEKERYAMLHDTNAMFVDMAIDGNQLYIAGLMANSDACVVGDIASDGQTVTFHSNQFMGVSETGEYFYYMVAAAPEDILNPDTGESTLVTGPADSFTAKWDAENKTLAFINTGTGFSITDGESKVGGGSLYMEPKFTRQDDFVIAAPDAPVLLAYNPYSDLNGYGTINFNLPFWTKEGLLIDPDNIYYNIYLDEEVMTLSTADYSSLEKDMTDIPYFFTDDYDIFSMGINHAVYLYRGGYERIGVCAVAEVDGKKYSSPVVYDKSNSIENVAHNADKTVEIYYMNMSGSRIDNPAEGLAIKCTRYADGTVKAEKVFRSK